MNAPRHHVKVARVLNEDDDFLTIEVAKHDGVTFHLQMDDEGETVGGDRFLTLVFTKTDGRGGMRTWEPWK